MAEMRANTYEDATKTVTVSPLRAKAIRTMARHYDDLFGNAFALDKLREQYAMNDNTLPNPEDCGRSCRSSC